MRKIYNLTRNVIGDRKRKEKVLAILLALCFIMAILTDNISLKNTFASDNMDFEYIEHTQTDESGYQCSYCNIDILHGHADGSISASQSVSTGFAGVAARSIGDSWDMSNYITGIEIRDINGQVVNNGSFYYDQPYNFNISFAERLGTNGQFNYNASKRLVYQLPAELTVTTVVTDGVILLANNAVVGHYSIDENGRVEIWFDDVDNQGNPSDYNFIDNYANVKFNLSINASFEEGTENGKISFGANAEIDVKLIDLPASLKVEKTSSTLKANTETIDYEIKITAIDNTVYNITLNDKVNFSNGFAIKNEAGYSYPFTNLQYQLPGGEWTNAIFTWDSGSESWVLSLPDGTSLKAGESINVKYTLNLSEVLDYCDTLGDGNRISRLDYNTTLNNTATAVGEDKSKKELESSATTLTTMKKTYLSKSGSYKQIDTENGKITWTATVGDGSIKLNNKTITDTWVLDPVQTLTGNVTVKLYNQAGTLVQTVTIEPPYDSNGFYSTGNGFTYTVPDIYGDVRKVEFVYDVSVDVPKTGSVKYENKVIINTLEKNASVTVNAPGTIGPGDIKLNKDSEWIWKDGKVTDIKYTMEIVVPAGLKGQKFYLKDIMSLARPMGNATSTTPEVTIYWNIENFSITATPSPDGTDNDPNLIWISNPPKLKETGGLSSADTVTTNFLFELYFGEKARDTTASNKYVYSEWQYNDQKTITISYTVSLDENKVSTTIGGYEEYNGKTLREMLNVPGWSLANRIGTYTSSASPINNSTKNDYFPIQKESATNATDSSLFDYTVYLNWTPWYNTLVSDPANKYPIFKAGEPAIFEDTFDPRLEYVPGSFYVERFATDAGTGLQGVYGPYSKGSPREDLVAVNNNTISVDFSKNFVEFQTSSWNGSPLTSNLRSGTGVIANSDWYYYNAANGYGRYKVHYQLRLKKEYTQTYPDKNNPLVLNNNASIYCTTDKFSGDGIWSDGSTVTYAPKAITKTMVPDGTTEKVEIIINPNGNRLRPMGVDKKQFTAVDTMGGDLAFYLDTIEIYTQTKVDGVWNGVWKKVEIADYPDLWSINSINAQTVEFELPDEQPVKIEYTALITAPVGSEASFSNNIEVYGYSDLVSEDKFKVTESNAGASAGKLNITLFKEDELTGDRLAGAEFQLYMYTKNVPYEDGHEKLTPSGSNMDFYHVCNAEYKNGVYVFDSKWIVPENNAVFLIVETKAPTGGYILPNEPYSFFVIHSIEGGDKTDLEETLGNGRKIQIIPDNIYITNKRPVYEKLVIGGKKQVEGITPPAATFSFTLTQVKNENGDAYEPANEAIIRTRNVATNGVGNYNFSFPEITNLSEGTYYFKVQETAATSASWKYDTSTQIVKVVISGDPLEANITVPTSATDSVTFINKFLEGPKFPEVGGIGRTPFTITAVIMTTLIFVFSGGTLIYRKYKFRKDLKRME